MIHTHASLPETDDCNSRKGWSLVGEVWLWWFEGLKGLISLSTPFPLLSLSSPFFSLICCSWWFQDHTLRTSGLDLGLFQTKVYTYFTQSSFGKFLFARLIKVPLTCASKPLTTIVLHKLISKYFKITWLIWCTLKVIVLFFLTFDKGTILYLFPTLLSF